MMAFFYKDIPNYYLKKFIAVRDSFDNLENILNLAEIINNCSHTRLKGFDKDSEIVLFTGDYLRVLIKKQDGYFSMALPFQVVDYGLQIAFNLELFEKGIDSEFIAIMRNAINSTKKSKISHEDILLDLAVNFNLDMSEATSYLDAFFHLVSETFSDGVSTFIKIGAIPENANVARASSLVNSPNISHAAHGLVLAKIIMRALLPLRRPSHHASVL